MSRLAGTERRLLALLAETSVHAGVGSQLGAVDLPIQRERHTEWPTIYGSGLKGVLRDHARGSDWGRGQVEAVFGPETDGPKSDEERFSGALAVSDAHLVLFPVRTVGPAFAWVTCPLALARLQRDASQCGLKDVPSLGAVPDADSVLVGPNWPNHVGGVLLEEFQFKAKVLADVQQVGAWIAANLLPGSDAYKFWHEHAVKHLVVVADDEFRDLVRHGTEIVTRVRLDEASKTVKSGALWTEENLPADSLLVSFVVGWGAARPVEGCTGPADVTGLVGRLLARHPVLQVGGKETVGRGFVATRLSGGN